MVESLCSMALLRQSPPLAFSAVLPMRLEGDYITTALVRVLLQLLICCLQETQQIMMVIAAEEDLKTAEITNILSHSHSPSSPEIQLQKESGMIYLFALGY